ncbi:MAG: LysR family transcriptional regulator [Oceanospirillaceae bacterium]
MKRLISKLPPHKALIAFEAVMRLGTVTAAAKELTSTQPAISQHIKNLEINLNSSLFKREGRLLKPTDTARSFYEEVVPLLMQMAEAAEQLRHDKKIDDVINIVSNSGLAHFWLLPMLPQLQTDFPHLTFNVTLSDSAEFVAENALLIGFGELAGAHQKTPNKLLAHRHTLFVEEVYAVCSAEYAAQHNLTANSSIEEMLQLPLIHLDEFDSRWLNWRDWLQNFGYKQQKKAPLVLLGNYHLVISQVHQQQGIALGWRCLVQHLLDQKQLVQVGSAMVRREGYGYFIDTQFAKGDSYQQVYHYLQQRLVTDS